MLPTEPLILINYCYYLVAKSIINVNYAYPPTQDMTPSHAGTWLVLYVQFPDIVEQSCIKSLKNKPDLYSKRQAAWQGWSVVYPVLSRLGFELWLNSKGKQTPRSDLQSWKTKPNARGKDCSSSRSHLRLSLRRTIPTYPKIKCTKLKVWKA